jgi:2,3-diketo-5-methylthio-1-phosphopentane phosphatase
MNRGSNSLHKTNSLKRIVFKEKYAIISDFDGTLAENNVTDLVLEHFAVNDDWKNYESLWVQGKISFEECIRKQYSLIRGVTKDKILSFVKNHSKIRNGFDELLKNCSSKKIEVVIVSGGLDFYIKYLIELNGFDLNFIKIVCPKAYFTTNGIQVKLPRKLLYAYSNFKEALVAKYKQKNYYVIYVGDGLSDYYPALRANHVFVIKDSVLKEKLSKCKFSNNFEEISDFYPINKFLKQKLGV